MKNSVIFTRFFCVAITTILMTAFFTTILFNYISRAVFTQIKENEMIPKANALGRIIKYYSAGDIDAQTLMRVLDEDEEGNSILDAYIMITDQQGNPIISSEMPSDDYADFMQEAALSVISNGILRTEQISSLRQRNLVGVGTPIQSDGQTVGAVVMIVPLYEALIAMSSLNSTLMISLLLCLPLVAIMTYYAIAVIMRPMKQMRDVAMRMADGNFDVRADITQRGEIGQLGRSLNYMAQELSRLISALTLERNRLKQVIDGLNEGIVAVDSLGRVTQHNPALSRLFPASGAPEKDEKRRLIPLQDVWDDFQCTVETGEGVVRQTELADKIILISITALRNKEGKVAGAVGLFSDVTERERLERTRRDYVANVSHELRSPLTAMRALVEPLNDGMVKDENARRRYYGIILREILRLSRLINDLMELSRLQSGTVALSRQQTRLQDIVEELEEKYAAAAEEKELSFSVTDEAHRCPNVFSNADRVEQILVILLDNAMKYTPEGGSVTLDASVGEEKVTMCVADTGIGIDQKDLPYVFDRFYKVDKAHSGLGSGLGLSIASELLQRMGEKIWAESELGKGTKFFFTLSRNQ